MSNFHFLEWLYSNNFEKRLKNLSKQLKDKSVLIYGTGQLFRLIAQNFDLSSLNIIGISDIKYSENTIGQTEFGYKVIPLPEIKNYKPDYILVASKIYDAIIDDFKMNLFKNTNIKIVPLVKRSLKNEIANVVNNINLPYQIKQNDLQAQIDNLHYLLNSIGDVKNFPKANGQLRNIQLKCAELLNTVHNICVENNLQYWLDSGTLLGAYRHKGFIPWDDDIDLCMQKKDLQKLIPIIKERFKNRDFYIRERAEQYNNYQIRIVNKHNYKIGLDIFPVEYYNNVNKLSEYDKFLVTKKIKNARKILDNKYWRKTLSSDKIPQVQRDIENIEKKNIYNGNNDFEISNNSAIFFSIDFPCDAKDFLVYDNEQIYPLKTIEFEGNFYYCPNSVEEYLENFYGDYMSYPKSFKKWWL